MSERGKKRAREEVCICVSENEMPGNLEKKKKRRRNQS